MRYKIIPILALLGLVLAVPANAALITQTYTFSGLPNFGDATTFNQYSGTDPLTNITIDLGVTISGGYVVVDNDAATSSTATVELGARSYLGSSSVTLPTAVTGNFFSGGLDAFFSQSYNLDPNVGDGSGDWSPAPPDGASYTGGTYSDSASGSVLSADYAAYMGTGTYSIDIYSLQHHVVTSSGGVEYAFNPVNVSGTITVTYEYTSSGGGGTVPEPGTMILFASGLGAVAAYRMRRKNGKNSKKSG